jgi:hypothetical protein
VPASEREHAEPGEEVEVAAAVTVVRYALSARTYSASNPIVRNTRGICGFM